MVETGSQVHKERYYLVREDILPESVLKTLEAKLLLAQGEVKTVHEAVDKVGLSRSAFYKYKDGIFQLNRVQQETTRHDFYGFESSFRHAI